MRAFYRCIEVEDDTAIASANTAKARRIPPASTRRAIHEPSNEPAIATPAFQGRLLTHDVEAVRDLGELAEFDRSLVKGCRRAARKANAPTPTSSIEPSEGSRTGIMPVSHGGLPPPRPRGGAENRIQSPYQSLATS